MKILAILLIGVLGFGQSLFADQNIEEVNSPIERMFVPDGFDDNDLSTVVLQGTFPNTCYQVKNTTAIVDAHNKKIIVTATALRYPDGGCAQILVPFLQEVQLGVLDSGTYTVVLNGKEEINQELVVLPRVTERHDNFLYAPVDSVTIIEKEGSAHAVLSGYYPHTFVGCMKFQEFRVKKVDNQDLLVVLPITTLTTDNDDPACQTNQGGQKFDKIIELNNEFNDVGLIHTRVMNGAAVNTLVPKM
jgi:hypothetical protein